MILLLVKLKKAEESSKRKLAPCAGDADPRRGRTVRPGLVCLAVDRCRPVTGILFATEVF